MYNVGCFPMKASPPHLGHINAILRASTQCKKLYVVASHNDKTEQKLYVNTPVKPISLKQKLKWLSIELSDFENIIVLGLDESASNIPEYPHGWQQWSQKLKDIIPDKIDVIFGGEECYQDVGYTTYFPDVEYVLYDASRTEYPVSATKIRSEPFKYWDYILKSTREHFVKKILITGTESCGKTTLVKMLAKVFNTNYVREEGRYYSSKYFGGNESVFSTDDFYKIAWEQRMLEEETIKNSNKIMICDTDAVVTQFYCDLYLGHRNKNIELFIDKDIYDLIFMLSPDVKWIADGTRWMSDNDKRYKLHDVLYNMYSEYGFDVNKFIMVNGDYKKRFDTVFDIIRNYFK